MPVEYQELGQIDGKQYFVPWDWGFTSILYNTEEVPEVTSWDALFNEEYADHISMWNDGPGAVAVSSYINGWDETAMTDDQLAQIEADWIAQKPLNAFYWSGEYTDLCPAVQDGTVWVAYAWQGCYATALAAGDPVAYANPEEGRNSWVGLYGISAETRQSGACARVPGQQAGGDHLQQRRDPLLLRLRQRRCDGGHRGSGAD